MQWLFLDRRVPGMLEMLALALLSAATLLIALPLSPLRVVQALSRGAGILSGVLAGGIALAVGYALNAARLNVVLLWLSAALVVLVVGMYLPGLEQRRHAARARRIDFQTVDFTGYLITMLRSGFGDAAILREYVRRPRAHVRDLQTLIQIALETQLRAGRGNMLEMLQSQADQSGSVALRDVVTMVRQVARQDRSQVVDGLAEQRRRLIELQIAAATRQAQRRENLVMLASAGALFFGMLLFILYVMTSGGALLQLI